MNTIKSFSIAFVFIIFLFGCSGSDGITSLSVSVSNGNNLVLGATVFTEPPTEEILTDASGQAIIANINSGNYDVFAIRNKEYSGEGKVVVNEGERAEIEILLEFDDFRPIPVELDTVELLNGSAQLKWSRFNGDGFVSYSIYRNVVDLDNNIIDTDKIHTIYSVDVVSYKEMALPLVCGISYFVDVEININDSMYSSSSNVENIEKPHGYIFNFTPSKIFHHPFENFIYLYYRNFDVTKIVKFDYVRDLQVFVLNLPISSNGNIILSKSGNKHEFLFPADDGHLYVYDLDLTQVEKLAVGIGFGSFAADENGHIMVMTGSLGGSSLVSIDRNSGQILQDLLLPNDIYGLVSVPGKNTLILAGSYRASLYSVSSDGLLTLTNEGIDKPYGSDIPNFAEVSSDNKFVVISEMGLVFDTTPEFNFIGKIEDIDLKLFSYSISDDNSKIYSCFHKTDYVHVSNSSDLLKYSEIKSKGSPRLAVEYKGQLIVIYSQGYGIDYHTFGSSSIEIIDL